MPLEQKRSTPIETPASEVPPVSTTVPSTGRVVPPDTSASVDAVTEVTPVSDTPNVPSIPTTPTMPSTTSRQKLPLRTPQAIDLSKFNALTGDWAGKPVEDIRKLFIKPVILEDGTKLEVETIKVPGFIGIADATQVKNPQGQTVSGHEDIAKFLEAYGLLICTYQWHKERYGTPFDLRETMSKDLFTEGFVKNEGHHSGAIVPASRSGQNGVNNSYATFNEPDDYHRGLYGKDGYVAVAQRLVFPDFVTPAQARGYTDTIINWMALLNPFLQFPSNYNGGDPVHVADRQSLKEILKNGLLASLGDSAALAFFKKPENMTYCAEFMFVALNTPVYPFNLKGLTKVLDGDSAKAKQVLAIRDAHNRKEPTILSRQARNPEFKEFTISMPVVSEDLLPLDKLMEKNGQSIDAQSIPLPPFRISQVIRRAFRTLLPRQQFGDAKLAKAQATLFKGMEPALIQQLGLSSTPASDPKVQAVSQFVDLVSKELAKEFASYEEFDKAVDKLMDTADEMLKGEGDRTRFVPPRIYVDLGQNDGDNNLPRGWGYRLETVGALVARSVIRD